MDKAFTSKSERPRSFHRTMLSHEKRFRARGGRRERRGLEKSWIAMIVDRKSYEPVSSSSPFLPLASRESMKGKKEGSRFMRRSSIESVNFVSRINLDSPRRQKTNAGQTERERERESVERLAQENYRSVNSIAEREDFEGK